MCPKCKDTRCDCKDCFGIPASGAQLNHLREATKILKEGKYFIDVLMDVGNAIESLKLAKAKAKESLARAVKRKEKAKALALNKALKESPC